MRITGYNASHQQAAPQPGLADAPPFSYLYSGRCAHTDDYFKLPYDVFTTASAVLPLMLHACPTTRHLISQRVRVDKPAFGASMWHDRANIALAKKNPS